MTPEAFQYEHLEEWCLYSLSREFLRVTGLSSFEYISLRCIKDIKWKCQIEQVRSSEETSELEIMESHQQSALAQSQ